MRRVINGDHCIILGVCITCYFCTFSYDYCLHPTNIKVPKEGTGKDADKKQKEEQKKVDNAEALTEDEKVSFN